MAYSGQPDLIPLHYTGWRVVDSESRTKGAKRLLDYAIISTPSRSCAICFATFQGSSPCLRLSGCHSCHRRKTPSSSSVRAIMASSGFTPTRWVNNVAGLARMWPAKKGGGGLLKLISPGDPIVGFWILGTVLHRLWLGLGCLLAHHRSGW